MPRAFALSCIVTLSACSGGGSGTTTGTSASGSTSATGTTSGTGTGSGTTSGTVSGATSGTTSGSSGAPVCGNGVVEAGEVCDLGAMNGQGVGCNITCTLQGQVTTIAGGPDAGQMDGVGSAAQFGRPYGLAVVGDILYVADVQWAAVRAVNLVTHDVQTIAGGHNPMNGTCIDGNGAATDPDAGFCEPAALLPFDGGLIVTDYGALRFLALSSTFDGGILSTFAGTTAQFGNEAAGFDAGGLDACIYGDPHGIAQLGLDLYTNTDIYGVLAETSLASSQMFPVESLGQLQEEGGMTSLSGLVYTSLSGDPGALYAYDPASGSFGPAGDAGFTLAIPLDGPDGICTDGQSIYICVTGTNEIKQYVPGQAGYTLVAGGADGNAFPSSQLDGLGSQASFFDPAGCAWDPVRKVLYVSDRSGNTIREIQ